MFCVRKNYVLCTEKLCFVYRKLCFMHGRLVLRTENYVSRTEDYGLCLCAEIYFAHEKTHVKT